MSNPLSKGFALWEPTVRTPLKRNFQLKQPGCVQSQAFERCVLTTACAVASDQTPVNLGPSPVDRLLAASMYMLPLYEGVWRLSVMCVRIAQYHTTDWLVWANRHGQQLRSGNDQAAVHAVIYTGQLLYQELATLSRKLLQWGSDSPSIMVRHGKIQSFNASPAHLDGLGLLVYMAAVYSLASSAFRHQQHQRPPKGQAEDYTNPSWSSLRMPQIIMGASACALMLRLSMVTMQGASGLARDTYKFVAVSLTLASVCTALAQSTQVAFGKFEQDGHMLLQLVQQASNIAWLHCALSLSDWGLMLTMPCAWSVKMQVGVSAIVAYFMVICVKHQALDTNWLTRRRKH